MRSGGAQKIPRSDNSWVIDGNPFQGLDTSALDSIDEVSSAGGSKLIASSYGELTATKDFLGVVGGQCDHH